MRTLIFAVVLFLCVPLESFCGEIISTGVEKKGEVYYIRIEIRVDAEKEKVLEIFSDPEKLKKTTRYFKKSRVVEKYEGGLKTLKVIEGCFLKIFCLQVIQNDFTERYGDEIIAGTIPEESDFQSGEMRFRATDENGKTIIYYSAELEPKDISKFYLLRFVSEKTIENKLIGAGKEIMENVEKMAAMDKTTDYPFENK